MEEIMKKSICGFVCLALVVAVTLVALGGCQKNQSNEEAGQQILNAAVTQNEKAVNRAELIATLESKNFDSTVAMMNRVKMTHYQGDLIPLLMNLWDGNFAETPQVDKAFVGHPRIRLEVADVLLQASRNGSGFNLNPNDYVEYARKHATSEDAGVMQQAILVLDIANDPKDLPLLEKLIAEEKTSTYRVLSIAYTNNCAVTKEAVERVSATMKNQEIREYLYKLWDEVQESRAFSCAKKVP